MKSNSHESQFAKIDSEHASRNTGSDSSSMSSPVGGSAKFSLPSPKEKSFPANKGDIPALKKLSSGRPDTAKPSKTVA